VKFTVEESTKIHSASELDEMVRRAKSDPAQDFENDEHTMIGNSQELAARSMSVPDAPPAPRASNNIIRRTGVVTVARPTSEPPATSDVVELTPDEDDAFAPWDDAGQRTSPQSADQLRAALEEAAPSTPAQREAPIEAPKTQVSPEELPWVEASLVSPVVAKPSTLRVERIIAIVAVALLIGVIALGYRRISALEDELAATKSALDAASSR